MCVTDDPDSVKGLIATVLDGYNDLPSYRGVMDQEGAAGPADVSLVGDEATVRAGLERFASAGTTDFSALEIPTNPDEEARTRRAPQGHDRLTRVEIRRRRPASLRTLARGRGGRERRDPAMVGATGTRRRVRAWSALFRGYADFYRWPTSDEHQRQIWGWIHDAGAVEALVAVPVDATGAEAGPPLGLAHLREWVRPLRGVVCGYLDDLFVEPDVRGQGAVEALFDEIRRMAGTRLGDRALDDGRRQLPRAIGVRQAWRRARRGSPTTWPRPTGDRSR